MEKISIHTQASGSILEQAASYVADLYDQQQDTAMVFHNYSLVNRIVEEAKVLMAASEPGLETEEIVLLTCWFSQVGYLFDLNQPIPHTLRILGRFFTKEDYPEDRRVKVVQCLQTVAHQRSPLKIEEKIVSDAQLIAGYLEDYYQQMELLKLEWELKGKQLVQEQDWIDYLKKRLLAIQLHTKYGRAQYQSKIGIYLLDLQNRIEKKEKKQATGNVVENFQGLEKNIPSRGAQTFFRTTYRNHINLSAIADNKANIMISVNAILISVLVTFLSYRNIAETKPMILLPVTLFLVTGLASLIFAVLSARPKVSKQDLSTLPQVDIKRNIIFFGTFSQLEMEDYEDAMDQVLRDDELLYGNMVRDLYYLGKVLDKKYRFLTLSYNIFMLGLILTVCTFLVILFT